MYSPERIRQGLRKQGRTVNWLAERTGYNPSTVTRFLRGTYPVSDEFAHKAADAFDVPVDWLREPAEPEAA